MAELLSATGSFITEGEKRAAEELKQLPDSWLVICNKTLPTSNGRSELHPSQWKVEADVYC